MPQPIVPVRQQDLPLQLFSPTPTGNDALSALQARLFGTAEPAQSIKEAKVRFPEQILDQLDSIYKHEDERLSHVQTVLAGQGEAQRVFGVPHEVSDGQLLSLKAAGLVVGQGRTVKFTDRGKIALRDKWMATKNSLAETRAKAEYVHPSRTASVKEEPAPSMSIDELVARLSASADKKSFKRG
jgi:hypothetical protein